MKLVVRRFKLIEDPLVVDYVNQIGNKLVKQLPPQPFKFRFYVLNEDIYNAFALPAGYIFINSGLLAAMDSEDELAGILSHEIAHVVSRHISKRIDRSQTINLASMAGIVAGIFLGASTGDLDAANTLVVGSVAAGHTASLAFSRTDETQADQLGLQYIQKAGYSGQGLLTILKKIRGKQWFGADQVPNYMMTHPGVDERIANIDTDMAVIKSSGQYQPPTSVTVNHLFNMINIRLTALYQDQNAAQKQYQQAIKKNPNDPASTYGYGLVLARLGKRPQAIQHLKKALTKRALDPVILSDLGRIYFLDGQYSEALSTLEGAVSLSQINPEGLFYLGRTRMELKQFEEAVQAFETLIATNPNYRPSYKFLGETYGRLERMPLAHYYLGIYHYSVGEFRVSQYHLRKAEKGIQSPSKSDKTRELLKKIEPLTTKKNEKQKSP
ncbi:MAG: M48 family metalloprotease [Desulfobacteraceae bacterium]|nr:M48 family metalloprotease [Desulfobacteraceae bacterium]